MKLAIDVDGVMADFNRAMNGVLTEVGPVALPPEYQPEAWDWKPAQRRAQRGEAVIGRDQYARAWDRIAEKTDFWASVEPIQKNIDELVDCVCAMPEGLPDLYFVTARKDYPGSTSAMRQTEMWLRRHMERAQRRYGDGSIPFSVLTVASAKRKISVFHALGMDASIDDFHANVERALRLKDHQAFLLDTCQNWMHRDLDGVRVKTVAEFFRRLRRS